MITHRVVTREVLPTPEQAKALALQIVAINKIIQGCPNGNPFGQSKGTFKTQYGVDLWANINLAMMGFSDENLHASKWRRQVNYRNNNKGIEFYPDGAMYIPALGAETGVGRLAVFGDPLPPDLPAEARVSPASFRVVETKRWWADFYITDRPRRVNKKRRTPIYT